VRRELKAVLCSVHQIVISARSWSALQFVQAFAVDGTTALTGSLGDFFNT
jgi:hypothetical protein